MDGVPAFWLPLDGPFRVALQFRVGQGHEPLSHRGISHLVEHLAFASLMERDHEKNGFVDEQRTVFWASGSEDEVASFLLDVATTIAHLPEARVETERRILSVEASRRGPSLAGSMLSWRYGPTGVGLLGYDELGLRWLDAAHVQYWADQNFTRQNAALWLSGPPPRGLQLPLRDGARLSWPKSKDADVPLPYCLRQATHLTGVGLLVDRDIATSSLIRIAERRLQTRLRHELGVAYEVGGGYLRVDAQTGHVVLGADSLPEQAGEVLREILVALQELAAEGPNDAEVQRDIDLLSRAHGDENAALGWLDSYALSELLGEDEPRTPAQNVSEIREATGHQGKRLTRFLASAIAVLNREAEPPGEPFVSGDVWSKDVAEGRGFPPAGRDDGRRLIVGDVALSVVMGEDRRATVQFDRCPACLWWADGSRVLYGEDGFLLRVKPWEWKDGNAAIALIDSNADPTAFVAMGEGTGPPPVAPPRPSVLPATSRGQRRARILGWLLWVLISALLLGLALSPPQRSTEGPYGITIQLDCGSRSSVAVVLHGLPSTVGAAERRPCREQATGSALGGLVGLVSIVFAAWIAWRWRRRDLARRRAGPAG
ncbi:MAG: zinc protease [Actinomycetota bacterium]|nr:zinc protease [Actinomycetota bacterium]